MRNILISILISVTITFIGLVGFYNYPLGNSGMIGSTLTTILGSFKIKDLPTYLNDNFSALNIDKIEKSTTTLPLITTLAGLTSASSLATVGVISSGTWHGSIIDVPYGGTGWSTIASGAVLYGNGSNKLATTTAGSDGQYLTLASGVPAWATSSLNLNADYSWGGTHTFASTTNFAGTTTQATTTINKATITNLSFTTISSTTVFGQMTASSANVDGTYSQVITVGFMPKIIKVIYWLQGHGAATSDASYRQIAGEIYFNNSGSVIGGENHACTNTNSDSAPCNLSTLGFPNAASFGSVGDNSGTGAISTTMSISSVTSTGFTINCIFDAGSSVTANAGRCMADYIAYQ